MKKIIYTALLFPFLIALFSPTLVHADPNNKFAFSITSSAGKNGSVTPNGVQVVNIGANLTYTATPNSGYIVSQWLVDGTVHQTGGTKFVLSNIKANHTVLVKFIAISPIHYSVTSTASTGGSITPKGSQTVNIGASLTLTANPNTNYVVYQWFVDGVLAQRGGAKLTLSNIKTNHNVNVTFNNQGTLYAGAKNGKVYFSFNNGATWIETPQKPKDNTAINSVFASSTTLYAGSEAGTVYSSTTNGNSWNSLTKPDGSAVNSVFATPNNELYVGTSKGHVYFSTNAGAHWTMMNGPDGTAVNSVFVTPKAQVYVGTAKGNVYFSTNGGTSWTTLVGPDGSAIKNVFALSDRLYVSTANEYVYKNSSLTSKGTWTPYAQTVYSLFVNAEGTNLIAGTQGGYLYSLSTGNELGFVTSSQINSVYLLM